MPRTQRRWSFLKKSPRHLGDDPGGPPERHSSRTVVAGRGAGGPEEQDRASLGPTGGTRPRAPHDQRTSSVSIFGAICPQQGKGAALVLPRCRDIVDHCCDAWNRLIDQPWLIMSIGLRDWANA